MDRIPGRKRNTIPLLLLCGFLVAFLSCAGSRKNFFGIMTQAAPVLAALSIPDTQPTSITLAMPVFTEAAEPAGTVEAYIGVDGVISYSGSVVTGYSDGPYDVSSSGHTFDGLSPNTTYTIIVVAQNSLGYWVRTITQNTSKILPRLADLTVGTVDSVSAVLDQPAFITTGNPVPTTLAYIGLSGTITVTGSTVTGFSAGPVDVYTAGCTFAGLSPNTAYLIIVVASNNNGYDVKGITINTAAVIPALKPLVISAVDTASVTLDFPAFSTAGNPVPSVLAYIGVKGTISASGSAISGYIGSAQDVSAHGYQFAVPYSYTIYTVYVVASNAGGYDVRSIDQRTSSALPALNALSISMPNPSTISLAKPTFAAAGNPEPSVKAYIGKTAAITLSGATVANYDIGPVDVSMNGCDFPGLSADTDYRIYVVAANVGGYDVKLADQHTPTVAPVMNNLAISAIDATSITLAQPTFSTAGSPLPTVETWIGLAGSIYFDGTNVQSFLSGPFNVSAGSYQFTSLSAGNYEIIVLAKNSAGFVVKTIDQSLTSNAPVLNPLYISAAGSTSITLALPTFSVSGNPLPTVTAYIGLQGAIGHTGSTITGTILGTKDVSSSSAVFSTLSPVTNYEIIVVADNGIGSASVETITKATMSNAKEITSFTIGGTSCTIAGTLITVNMPFYSSLDSLAAAFVTTGVRVTVDGAVQTSGTSRDFNLPVTYVVQAEDGSTQNYTVTVTTDGAVSTLALSTAPGYTISGPMGMTTNGVDLYIANTGLSDILEIASPSASPTVSRFAGLEGVAGFVNGYIPNVGTVSSPRGVTYKSNSFMVADSGNNAVRKISKNQMKINTSYSGLAFTPCDIGTDGTYLYMTSGSYVYLDPGIGSFVAGNAAPMGSLCGLVYAGGYLYVADSAKNCINRIKADGTASTFAGSGVAGYLDGVGTAAQFNNPQYMTTDGFNLYVTDGSHSIRKISLATQRVSTIAGKGGLSGTADGKGPNARFSNPEGLVWIANVLYVVDSTTNRIRKIE